MENNLKYTAIFAALGAVFTPARLYSQEPPHWEVRRDTSTSKVFVDPLTNAVHWESQLTTGTTLVSERFHVGPGETDQMRVTFAIKYADSRAPWVFDFDPETNIEQMGPFGPQKAFILSRVGRGESLRLLDTERREIEPVGGVPDTFFIDSRKNLFAFVGEVGQVFLNHSRVFPEPILNVHYGRLPPHAFIVQDGKQVTTASDSLIAEGYFEYSAVVVKQNMDVNVILLKSKSGRPVGPDAPPYYPKPDNREYYLIDAHPENPDPESPGKWTIKKTLLSKDDATSMSKAFYDQATTQLQKTSAADQQAPELRGRIQ